MRATTLRTAGSSSTTRTFCFSVMRPLESFGSPMADRCWCCVRVFRLEGERWRADPVAEAPQMFDDGLGLVGSQVHHREIVRANAWHHDPGDVDFEINANG